MLPERTPVLVVGAGPVGLASAAFLGWHGIASVVVDRHPGLSRHPRSRGVTPRSMELLRVIGLEDRVRGADSARELAGNDGIIMAETLAGRQLGEMRKQYFQFGADNYAGLSPTSWCMVHQDELEPLLRDRAGELGADVHFGVECKDLLPEDDGVTAVLTATSDGVERRLRADYVIAADGAASPIRERLGIGTTGPGRKGHFLNIQFEADLRDALGDRRFIMCYITGAGVRCAMLPVNNADRWMLHVMCEPEEVPGFTEERCAEVIRAAAGVPDLEVTVQGALPWEAAGRVADRMRAGRVFLAGDSAHVMPPTGAFGANTGIQDAHNLAWKLAAVLRGQAGDALLDSYEAERRPVAWETMTQALRRSTQRPGAAGEEAQDAGIVPDPVVVLGYRYQSSAIVTEDAVWEQDLAGEPGTRAPHVAVAGGSTSGGADAVWERDLVGEPGTRAPHVVVAGGSTIDLFRRRFVLLAGPAAAGAWLEAGDTVGRELALPLDTHVVDVLPSDDGAFVHDLDGTWAASYGVGPDGAVLVRPDGFVAWRAVSVPGDPGGELRAALSQVLSSEKTVVAQGV